MAFPPISLLTSNYEEHHCNCGGVHQKNARRESTLGGVCTPLIDPTISIVLRSVSVHSALSHICPFSVETGARPSMWLELLLGVVLLFAWLYRYVTKQFGEFTKRGMPFAKPSFPFGSSNAKKLFSGQLSFFDLEKDLAESDEFKNEKAFGYFMMGQPTVVINDEELAKLVMIKDFDHFDELRDFGYVINTRENQLFNHMLTSMPGHKWRKIRNMLNPCFTGAKLRGMVPHLDKAAGQMVAFLDDQEGQDLDGRDLFGKFTMDALASGGYGLETDSFADPDNIFRKMALTLAGAPGFASPWDMPR